MKNNNDRLLIVICGSIAAYKSVDFIRKLKDKSLELEVILTESAKKFVAPKTLETFLGKKVISNDHFDDSHLGTEHIDFARKFDAVLVYGATAEFMASYKNGNANDFSHAQLLAFKGPVFIMPAMNPSMWAHPATVENVRVLKSWGVTFFGPSVGAVACGEFGEGRLVEEDIAIEGILSALSESSENQKKSGVFSTKKVLLSLGAMAANLDDVRTLQNNSSGEMGFCLAKELIDNGAQLKIMKGLLSSSVESEFGEWCRLNNIESFDTQSPQKYSEVLALNSSWADVFISSAAVLDFEIVKGSQKLDRRELFKGNETKATLELTISKVEDFAKSFGQSKRKDQVLVSFSAESLEDETKLLERACQKAKEKNSNLCFVNRVSQNSGPGQPASEAWLIKDALSVERLGFLPKGQLARQLLKSLEALLSVEKVKPHSLLRE